MLAEPDAPHSRKAAAAAERHDVTLMQPLLPEPAFDEYSVTLAVWTFIVKRMYGVHTWIFAAFRSAQPSGLRSLLVCLWKVGVWFRGPDKSSHQHPDFAGSTELCGRERDSPISLATQQQQLMACVAVIRVPVYFVDTVAISAWIGLTVIYVPGHLFFGHYFQSKRRWKLPGTFKPRGLAFRTECQTPDLVGPAPVALYNRLRASRAKESNVPSSVRSMLLWYVPSAQLHPCSQTVFTKRTASNPTLGKVATPSEASSPR